jgi:transglutaminase superfamily protein
MELAPGEPDDAAVGRFLEIVAMVPPGTRRFTVPAAAVARAFGLRAELLTRMVGLGLPSAEKDGVAYFERSDLVNMSVRLRTGTRYLTIRRFWPRAIRALEGKSQMGYSLSYVASCPSGQPHPGCSFRVLTPRGSAERPGTAGQPGPIYTTDVWLSCEWPELPAIAREVVDIAEKFELTWLPLALRTDTGFMRSTGLANCIGLSRILAAESRKRGLQARSVFGFLASPPYGNIHFWAEVRAGELWVPIDPMMIRTMIGWDVLDSSAWTPYRSLGGILCKLGSRSRPVVTHDSREVAASFPVSHL